jgi:hypothetical protein
LRAATAEAIRAAIVPVRVPQSPAGARPEYGATRAARPCHEASSTRSVSSTRVCSRWRRKTLGPTTTSSYVAWGPTVVVEGNASHTKSRRAAVGSPIDLAPLGDSPRAEVSPARAPRLPAATGQPQTSTFPRPGATRGQARSHAWPGQEPCVARPGARPRCASRTRGRVPREIRAAPRALRGKTWRFRGSVWLNPSPSTRDNPSRHRRTSRVGGAEPSAARRLRSPGVDTHRDMTLCVHPSSCSAPLQSS